MKTALLFCSYGTAEVCMIPRHHFLTCEKQYLGNLSAFMMQTKKRGKQCSQNKSSAQNKHLQDLLSVFSSSFLSSSWSPLMFCVMTNKQSKLYHTSKTLIYKQQLVWNIPVREFFCQQLQKLHHILCKTNKFVYKFVFIAPSFYSFYTKVAMRTIASRWCSD